MLGGPGCRFLLGVVAKLVVGSLLGARRPAESSMEDLMPTGPKHQRLLVDNEGRETGESEDCRCTIGDDHREWESETLSVDDASDIWRSRGMDEDYTFGYSESELRDAGDDR